MRQVSTARWLILSILNKNKKKVWKKEESCFEDASHIEILWTVIYEFVYMDILGNFASRHFNVPIYRYVVMDLNTHKNIFQSVIKKSMFKNIQTFTGNKIDKINWIQIFYRFNSIFHSLNPDFVLERLHCHWF